jgi:hypothetical protein
MYILKPLQSSQTALEGDKYVSISLVPYIIHQLRIELELCLGAANVDMQGNLILLLNKMIDDFKSRWGDELRYSYGTRRGDRNCQIGVHAYSHWAMALVPRTKKYLTKILNHRDTRLLWDDIKECCLEEATAARIANQEEEEQMQTRGYGYKWRVLIIVHWNGGGFTVQITHTFGKYQSRFLLSQQLLLPQKEF